MLNFLAEEIKITFLQLKRYPMVPITMAITLYAIFLGIFFGVSNIVVDFNDNSSTALILGYILWSFAIFALNDPAEKISEEIYTGLLEQVYTSSFRPLKIAYIRGIASFINAFVVSTVIFVLAIVTMRISIDLAIISKGILILIPMVIGIYGIGLIMAGATLRFVRVGQLGQILNFVLLLLAGIVIPLNSLPNFFYTISKIIPLTHAVELIRVLVEGRGVSYMAIFTYIVLNGFYLGLGSIFFIWINKKVRIKGNLGKY